MAQTRLVELAADVVAFTGAVRTATLRMFDLSAPDITEEAAAQQLADTYLAAHTVPKVVRYPTRRFGLRAGQSQTITVPGAPVEPEPIELARRRAITFGRL